VDRGLRRHSPGGSSIDTVINNLFGRPDAVVSRSKEGAYDRLYYRTTHGEVYLGSVLRGGAVENLARALAAAIGLELTEPAAPAAPTLPAHYIATNRAFSDSDARVISSLRHHRDGDKSAVNELSLRVNDEFSVYKRIAIVGPKPKPAPLPEREVAWEVAA